MRALRHRQIRVIGLALIIGLIMLIAIWPRLLTRTATVQDVSFQFTFCKVTQGTSHTVHSGIPVLGLLNRTFVRSGHRRISRDQPYSWVTPQATTCVSVGFRHDGDVLKRDPKNGLLYPEDAWLLQAVLVQEDGQTVALQQGRAGYGPRGPYAEEYLNSWDVPLSVTNLRNCQLRLSKKKDGTSVATFSLH